MGVSDSQTSLNASTVLGKIRNNISKCCLLKFLPSMQNVKKTKNITEGMDSYKEGNPFNTFASLLKRDLLKRKEFAFHRRKLFSFRLDSFSKVVSLVKMAENL